MAESDLRSSLWLPVRLANGEVRELGLIDVLRNAHELKSVEGNSPIVTVSLIRFLTGLVHHMLGEVVTAKELAKLLEMGEFPAETIDDYFDDARYGRRFDLFSNTTPFWQLPGLTNIDPKTKADRPVDIAALLHEVASGNNKTLFSHHFDTDELVMSPAQAARTLITTQYFALGGLNKKTSSLFGLQQSYHHGPFVAGMPTLVTGSSLFETLLLNIVVKRQRPAALQHLELGDPPWAEETASMDLARRDANKVKSIPSSYLEFFLPRSRHIRLISEKATNGTRCVRRLHIAQGVAWDPTWEPWFPLVTDSKKATTWGVQQRVDRAVWRDSGAYLGFETLTTGRSYRPPKNLLQYTQVRLALATETARTLPPTARLEILAISNDRAKPLTWRHDVMDLSARAITDRKLVKSIENDLAVSERIARILSGAIRFFFQGANGASDSERRDTDPNSVELSASRSYWAMLDLPFRRRLTQDVLETDFISTAIRIAREDFERTMNSVVAGNIRLFPARAHASARFLASLSKIDQE